MASTYSTNLKLQLMATGENTGSWGTVTNTNLGTALEEAIVGSVNVTFSSADVTLTLTNTNAAQTARNMRLVLTGTSGGARQLVVPAVEKIYIVQNNLADACTVKVSGQTGVSVPAGKTMWLCNDGTDVKDVVTHLSSLTLASAFPVASGGTGATSLTANNVLLGNGTSAVQFVAPGTSGNVLTSNGTTWISSLGFPSGGIIMWSGSIGTIPSGWALCDGTNGTPNLRDRFIVGAGSTYAVNATGGSATTTLAEANLPSHTHSFSATTGNQSADHNHTFSGTTSGQSQTHTHSATDSGHTHSVGAGATIDNVIGQRYSDNTGNINSTGSQTTGTGTANISVGNASVDHNHTYSGTTSGVSANHNHSVSGTTGATGSGTSFTNLPPYYALAYIMKL